MQLNIYRFSLNSNVTINVIFPKIIQDDKVYCDSNHYDTIKIPIPTGISPSCRKDKVEWLSARLII